MLPKEISELSDLELPDEVIQALKGIREATSMGKTRRAARMAYIGNRAPETGQNLIQEAVADARHRLGQSPQVVYKHEMSW